MGGRAGQTRKYTVVSVFIIVLVSVGFLYTFFIYIPMYEAERSRLLTLYTHADPQTLDPALSFDTSSHSVIVNIFDRLVVNKRGTTDVFEPSLALSWETPNNKTYIFHLRTGVMFHDGTPFNATSVKYSLDRIFQLAGPSYLFYMINETTVLDTYKVQITLYQEFAPFLSIMAHPVASIVSQSAVETHGENFTNNPVGTGPFRFEPVKDLSLASTLTLTANKDYFKGAPRLEGVVFRTVLEAAGRRTELEQGRIDVVFTAPPAVSPDDLTALENNPDIKIYKGVSLSYEFIGFNMLKSPLNDSKVREAIAYAIDYDAIIDGALGGRAERLGGPIPPGVLGYKALTLKQRDLTRASQLLDEAGYSDGFEITLTYNIENLERYRVAQIIETSLDDVNIDVRIKGLDFQSVIQEILTMGHEMFIFGWTPDYPDPDAYLTAQYHSIMGWANVFGLSNSSIDTLLEQGLTVNGSQRAAIYHEVQEMIVEQTPCIYTYVPSIYDCVRFNVNNWIHNPYEVIDIYELYKN